MSITKLLFRYLSLDKAGRQLMLKNAFNKSVDPRVQEISLFPNIAKYAAEEQSLDKVMQAIVNSYWAYVCIDAVAERVSTLPMKFYRGWEIPSEIFKHRFIDLLYRPNPFTNHIDFWYELIFYRLAAGNCYIRGDRWVGGNAQGAAIPSRGGPTELYFLPPEKVKIVPDATNFVKQYDVIVNGKEVVIPAVEVIHIKKFNPLNVYYGLSPITVASKILGSDWYARDYNERFFKYDASTDNILTTENELSPEAIERLKTQWALKHSGVKDAHRMTILESGLKYQNLRKGPKDLDWANLIKLNREEILAIFKVPPAEVGIFEYANYANAQIQQKIFWERAILPALMQIEAVFNEQVFPSWSPSDEQFWMEFDVSEVEALQENKLEKAQIQQIQWQCNIKTINELRGEENLEPVENGDVLYSDIQVSLVPKFAPPGNGNEDEPTPADEESEKTFKAVRRRVEKWVTKDAMRRRWEAKFVKAMNRYFDQQHNRVKKRLASMGEITAGDVEKLFPLSEETELAEMAGPFIKEAVKDFGQAGIDEVVGRKRAPVHRIKVSPMAEGLFDVTNPKVAAFIRNKVARFVTRVSDSTRAKIRRVIEAGYEDGKPIKEIADDISTKFDEFGDVRSFTIAQTEMGAAANMGNLFGYEQSGVVEKKEWLATPDERVREAHLAAMEAGPIPLNDNFIVDGEELSCPGDPAGSPGNIINCRCSISPVIEMPQEE